MPLGKLQLETKKGLSPGSVREKIPVRLSLLPLLPPIFLRKRGQACSSGTLLQPQNSLIPNTILPLDLYAVCIF